MTATGKAAYRLEDVAALDCRYEPRPWPFALERQADIARHWAEAVRQKPLLFDGRVLMQCARTVERGPDGTAVFRARYSDVDFSAFLAWRDFGRPGTGFGNGFGLAALQGADDGFVLGVMGDHTANAGRVYFPSGTPDLGDVTAKGAVDIAASIRRELQEETGLDAAALGFEERFTLVQDPHRTAIFQRVRSPETADALARRVRAWLATLPLPELAGVTVVRTAADLTDSMPPFVRLYLRRAFAEGQPG